MFKNMLRELEKLNGTMVSVPIEADAEGYLDKECPAETCLFNFKIFSEDWKNICRDEEIFCPSCRHAAPAKSWFTREQVKATQVYARNHIIRTMNSAMRTDARDWNRRQQRNSFIKMTMEVKGSDPIMMPVTAAEPMRLKATCETCGCRYSYVGAAFFCPSCGKNSAQHMFRQTLTAIRGMTSADDVLRASFDADQAEVLARSLLEKGLQDAVMSFQRLAEQVYADLPNPQAARRNVFQNVDEGTALWAKVAGHSYTEGLSEDEQRRLRIYYQQRHLLAHRQGIVDEEYRSRSGDMTYAVGQRIIIKKADVLDFVGLIERMGATVAGRTSGADSERASA